MKVLAYEFFGISVIAHWQNGKRSKKMNAVQRRIRA
jgi:hypothetical protein